VRAHNRRRSPQWSSPARPTASPVTELARTAWRRSSRARPAASPAVDLARTAWQRSPWRTSPRWGERRKKRPRWGERRKKRE
jgi:hypothetical protein